MSPQYGHNIKICVKEFFSLLLLGFSGKKKKKKKFKTEYIPA